MNTHSHNDDLIAIRHGVMLIIDTRDQWPSWMSNRAKAVNVLGKVIRNDNELWVRSELKKMNCKINIEYSN